MGRPPCCQTIGAKKGPWTPEEDIILVSYIHQHGPGNWRSVPNNTGLLRCSKSCRLRWTNYLRPGIKRGQFSEHEDNMIVHLQALLGNRWAAIASYLPQRTDNDIKNYWNTHLKKRLKLGGTSIDQNHNNNNNGNNLTKGQWERRLQTDIQTAKQALTKALSLSLTPTNQNQNQNNPPPNSSSSTYVSNAENIAQLLKNWTKNSPTITNTNKSESTTSGSQNFSVEAASCSNNSAQMEDELHEHQIVPFNLLEKWLFDEAAASQYHQDFLNFSLQDSEAAAFFN